MHSPALTTARARLPQSGRAALLWWALMATACVGVNDEFACTEDAACIRDGEAGRCARGSCMFADWSCEASGWRFDEHSGAAATQCAECGSGGDSVCADGDRPSQPIAAAGVGFVELNLRYAHDDTETSCGNEGDPDAFLELQLTAPSVFYADVPSPDGATLALRAGACADASSPEAEVLCERGNCVQGTTQVLESLAAGAYCLVVESRGTRSVRYAIHPSAKILGAAPEPVEVQGNTCELPSLVDPCGKPPAGASEQVYAITACEVPMVLIADLVAPAQTPELAALLSVRGGDDLGFGCTAYGDDADSTLELVEGVAPIIVPMPPPSIYWVVADGTAARACGWFRFVYAQQVAPP
jgi:hypothetical protein